MTRFRKIGVQLQIQFDQITWSVFTFLSNLQVAQYYSLSLFGLINLILILTYANLNVVKSKYLFHRLGSIQSELTINKIAKENGHVQKIFVILLVEGIIVWMVAQYLSADIRMPIELTILFICISFRDINRTVNIHLNRFLTNLFRNMIALITLFALHFFAHEILNPIEIWIIAILASLLVRFQPLESLIAIGYQRIEERLLSPQKQKILAIDSFVTQVVNIVTSFLLTKLEPAVMGNIALIYICIAAVGTTIGTGVTGKKNLTQLNLRIPENSIFVNYLTIQCILSVNLILVWAFKPIVEDFFGAKFSQSEQLLLFVFLLYSTIMLVQFYTVPMCLNCSRRKFILFRIVSFHAMYFMPLALVADLSLHAIHSMQLTTYFFLFYFVRRNLI